MHEISFHQFMTAAYGGLVIVGLVIYLVQTYICVPRKMACMDDSASFYLFYMVCPGAVFALLSYMCLAICNGGSTMAAGRFVIMLLVLCSPPLWFWGSILFFDFDSFDCCSDRASGPMCAACRKAPESAHSLALFGLFFFLICDVTLAGTNRDQALYWAAGVSIPWMEHIAPNKRCSNTETLFYVFWTTISGFVGFLIVLLLTNNASREANHYFGNIYMLYVSKFYFLIS